MRRCKSYIKPPAWIKNKGATINPKNMKDDYCIQYAVSDALNHKYIKRHTQRNSKIKLLIIAKG